MKSIQKLERFDADKLKYIVKNAETPAIKDILGAYVDREMLEKNGKDYSTTIHLAKKYLKFSRHGKYLVTYKQIGNSGRQYACGALGLQSICRPIRQAICSEFYFDIDMVNAHPTILLKMCEKNNIYAPALEQYVNDREACLVIPGLSRGEAKQLYLKIMNGGTQEYSELRLKGGDTPHLSRFAKEVSTIWTGFINDNEAAFKKYKPEKDHYLSAVRGGFVNTLLCVEENKILMKMWKFFGKPVDCVLCFDGIMIRKHNLPLERHREMLDKCSEYIKQSLGYDIKLEVKPMLDGLKLPENIPVHTYPPLQKYSDKVNLVTEPGEVVSELAVIEYIDNALPYIVNGGEGYFMIQSDNIDPVTGVSEPEKKPKSEKSILWSLRTPCFIANPLYDQKFADQHKDVHAKHPARKDTRFHKTLYNRISDYLEWRILNAKVKLYEKVEFIPYNTIKYGGKEPDFAGYYNLFTGFPMEKFAPNNDYDFEESHLYKIITGDLCNGNPIEAGHLLDTIADMVQQPARLQEVAHLFYSGQGTGKSMLVKFMSRLLGKQHVVTIIQHDRHFTSPFNAATSMKLLKVFEELPAKGMFQKGGYDQLKAEITSETEMVELKGKDAYVVKNYASIWSMTNNENAMFVENSDRRNVLHKCSNAHMDDKDYFAPAYLEIADPKFIKVAFDYFSRRPYDPKFVSTAIDTNYKQEQKEVSMPNVLKRLREFIETTYTREDHNVINSKDKLKYRISVEYLSELSGTKRDTVKAQMKSLKIVGKADLEPERKKDNLSGKYVQVYTIYPPDIELRFQSYLKNPNFKFNYPEPEIEEPKKVTELDRILASI